MVPVIGDYHMAIGGDHFGGFEAEASGAPPVGVEAETAVQEKAAQRNRRAVPDGKGQPLGSQLIVEVPVTAG